ESAGAGNNWVPNALAVSTVTKVPGGYQLDQIRKSYVTSAGQATHYFFVCKVGQETPATDLTLLFIDASHVSWEILEPWQGLGMRGNGSSPMRFRGVLRAASQRRGVYALRAVAGAGQAGQRQLPQAVEWVRGRVVPDRRRARGPPAVRRPH